LRERRRARIGGCRGKPHPGGRGLGAERAGRGPQSGSSGRSARGHQLPSQAARLAGWRQSRSIEIYRTDVAVWSLLQIRARIPGTVRLLADGAAAEAKAIWVLRNGSFDIEGIAFEGARVAGANGAGIRFENGSLRLAACRFADNEGGMLTGNEPGARLTVENCEFEGRRQGNRFGHNLVGRIASFRVTDSWFHTGFGGICSRPARRRAP
jgi:hypothetical protein